MESHEERKHVMFYPGNEHESQEEGLGQDKGNENTTTESPHSDSGTNIQSKIRGWLNYYCEFSKWSSQNLWFRLNIKLTRRVMNLRKIGQRKAHHWLKGVYQTQPGLFAHWGISRPLTTMIG